MKPQPQRLVNATRLASRCALLALNLRGEADRWEGAKRADLMANSAMLSAAVGTALRKPDETLAVFNAGLTILTLAAKLRLERDEAAFLADPKGFAHE